MRVVVSMALISIWALWSGAALGAEPPASEPTKTSVKANGLVADFYTPADAHERLAAIIDIGGSEGGMSPVVAKHARLIAQHGYAVLQLAYFDAPGLPKQLGLIPLEYFKSAIDWLRSQPTVDPERIGIEGTSVGGETALVVAAHYRQIKAVVAAVPSSVVWPGISRTNQNPPSTFSLGGKPLPYLPYGWTGPFKSIFALYDDGLKQLATHEDAVIQVERINGPIMLICGKDDSLWPSCPMSEQVSARLKAKGFKPAVHLLAFPDAGHGCFGPPADPSSPNYPNLGSLGGSPDGNNAARRQDWPESIAFFDAALKK